MISHLEHVEVGTRVSYEDMANPRREGVISEILMDGREFQVEWSEGSPSSCISDLRQYGWHVLADLPGNPFDGADIISVYTRTDAIRDGVLIPVTDLTPDEPDFARQAGFVVPVCLTTAVANLIIPTEREARDAGQDVKGRLWDVLSMARLHARRTAANETTFPCIFWLAGTDRDVKRAGQKTLQLKAVIGPDDDGSPCLTIMLRTED
jgi:hypothetical protein